MTAPESAVALLWDAAGAASLAMLMRLLLSLVPPLPEALLALRVELTILEALEPVVMLGLSDVLGLRPSACSSKAVCVAVSCVCN